MIVGQQKRLKQAGVVHKPGGSDGSDKSPFSVKKTLNLQLSILELFSRCTHCHGP